MCIMYLVSVKWWCQESSTICFISFVAIVIVKSYFERKYLTEKYNINILLYSWRRNIYFQMLHTNGVIPLGKQKQMKIKYNEWNEISQVAKFLMSMCFSGSSVSLTGYGRNEKRRTIELVSLKIDVYIYSSDTYTCLYE